MTNVFIDSRRVLYHQKTKTMCTNKTKKCKKCGDPKPLTEFSQNINMRDGYTNVCYACKRDRSKQKYQEAKNDIWSFNLISGYKNTSSLRLHDLRVNG